MRIRIPVALVSRSVNSYTERIFVRVNHKSELYFCLNKWNICLTNCYKSYENLKFTISKLGSETKNVWIWKALFENSLTPPKGLTFRSGGSGLWILVSLSNACKINIIIIPYLCSHISVHNTTIFIIAYAWK